MITYKILKGYNKENDDIWNEISSFEKSFSYPYGDSSFVIQHGRNGHYTDFYTKIGYGFISIIFYYNNNIIGILSGIFQKEFLYICDFKMKNVKISLKNKRILFKDLLNEININSFYFINMSKPENNPIIKLIKLYTGYSIKTESKYITEFSKTSNYLIGKKISTNMGIKDLIIENHPMNLYHVKLNGSLDIKDIPDNSVIMDITDKKINNNSVEITLGYFNKKPDIELTTLYL